ncbi:TPA: hypothetical protein ACQVG6_005296, partial [Serratia marcescens]
WSLVQTQQGPPNFCFKIIQKSHLTEWLFCFQIWSGDIMAIEQAVQCEWIDLLQSSLSSGALIPASAVVAICLFILREILEGRRKCRVRKNEIRALKRIFARECQLAWYRAGQIKKLSEIFAPFEKAPEDECPFELKVFKTTAGKIRYLISKNGAERLGGMLPEQSTTTFEKYLYDTSKIDSSFYEKVNAAYTAVIEIKHLHESLIDHQDSAEIIGIQNVMLGFSSYALEEIAWIEKEIKALYKTCTGKELTSGLLR